MLLYLGRKPGSWLEGAWQVSGVLIGLVIALIIFLLQSAASQSLRSDATFRAVLRRAGVLWPVSWALVFIAYVGVVERFTSVLLPAGSFVETYTLALFVVQVALFAAAFFSSTRVVSPQGVAKSLAGQFRDGVVIAVEARLVQQLATARMLDCCQLQGVTYGSFLAHGWPVEPTRSGWVADLNAGGMPQPPRGVLNDAVDLARRALLEGSNVSRGLAIDLIADFFIAYHDAYALYGVKVY
jgi:hypothetical protein